MICPPGCRCRKCAESRNATAAVIAAGVGLAALLGFFYFAPPDLARAALAALPKPKTDEEDPPPPGGWVH